MGAIASATLSLFIGLYISGSEQLQWPTSIEQLSIAIGAANAARVLVLSAIPSIIRSLFDES